MPKVRFEMSAGHAWVGEVLGPGAITVQWDGRRPGDPDLVARVEVVDGRPVLAEVHARMRPGGREIELRDLAQPFSSETLVAGAWSRFASVQDGRSASAVGGADDTERDSIRGVVSRSRNRRRLVPHAELLRVAEVYREHAGHRDGKPVQAVAEALGFSRATASRRIKEAELAGLLPATTPGKRREA